MRPFRPPILIRTISSLHPIVGDSKHLHRDLLAVENQDGITGTGRSRFRQSDRTRVQDYGAVQKLNEMRLVAVTTEQNASLRGTNPLADAIRAVPNEFSILHLLNKIAIVVYWGAVEGDDTLAFLDTFRTMCLAPEPDFRRLLETIQDLKLAA